MHGLLFLFKRATVTELLTQKSDLRKDTIKCYDLIAYGI